MSIEVTVELYCDECINAGDYIVASTVVEAKAEARKKGWTLNRNGHFCHCNEQGWRGGYYRPHKGELAAEREWQEQLAVLQGR